MTDSDVPVLQVDGLVKHFPVSRGLIRRKVIGMVRAVENVSFEIARGETLALVGESGCGKSTTGRLVLRLMDPTGGSVRFKGEEIAGLNKQALRRLRRHMQIIFQDPYASLNPRMTVGEILAEPMAVHDLYTEAERGKRVRELLDVVGLLPEHARRYPHQFSGGMRQRVMIAMALACTPSLLIADEPTTALDVTVQAQILQLLKELRKEMGMTIIFITHDMGVVANLCDRVNVMYGGWLMETASILETFNNPMHPYTKALLSAIPSLDSEVDKLQTIPGEPPNLLNLPSGCPFQSRCDKVTEACKSSIPLNKINPRHVVKCTLYGNK